MYCHPAYLTSTQSTSREMPDWKKQKLESRLPGEISTTPDRQMTPPLWRKAKRKYFYFLMKVKEESEKDSLKLSIQKMKIMTSGPITSWQIDGGKKKWKQLQTLFSWAPKSLGTVTAAVKFERCLPL